MKKLLVLISVALLIAAQGFAQNSASKKTASKPTTSKTPNAPTLENTDAAATTEKSSVEKKLDAVGKPLESTALVDNIQGGMANLLMGNKSVSLMFDDRENDNIEKALESYKNNEAFTPDQDASGIALDKDAQDQLAKAKAATEQDEFNQKSYIYLASVLYSTPQDWVVWINDKKITSKDNKKGKELFLKSVERDKVSILWNVSPSKLRVLLGKKADDLNFKTNESGQIEVKFSLQPNQTFLLGSNSVVEGKIMTNMIKQKGDSTQSDTSDSTNPTSQTEITPDNTNRRKTKVIRSN